MSDRHTRRMTGDEEGAKRRFADYLARHKASLVATTGPAAGVEIRLEREQISIGRSEEADVRVDDESVSRLHAVIEFAGRGYRIRDLGSTNGVEVNGMPTQSSELRAGDAIRLGEHEFRFLEEEVEPAPDTYVLNDA